MIFLIPIIIVLVMYSLLPTYYFKYFNKKTIKSFKNKNNISLTFDDGPDKIYTEKLLDLLKQFNVKATFFVVAKSAAKNPHIIERMIKEGHLLGLHSLEHKNALLKGYFYTRKDFAESMAIMDSFDWEVDYYRPPWGHLNLFSLYFIRKYNLKLILWTVIVGDWKKSSSAASIESRVLANTKGGDFICLHDGRGSAGAPGRTIKALENVIPQLQHKGFSFTLLEDTDE